MDVKQRRKRVRKGRGVMIEVEPDVGEQLRARAAQEDRTIRAVVTRFIRRGLETPIEQPPA